VKLLNREEYGLVHGGYAACMSFPANTFNNGSQTGEPEKLQEWTNMTNGTQTQVGSELKWNGPDIHPTPAGYVQLGKEMAKEAKAKCHKEGLPGF
jgi:glutathione peroxidase-family protein